MKRFVLVIISLQIFLLHASFVQADYGEVILLGTGTPQPSIKRFGPATLVSTGGKYFLFDVGRGATIRLNQIGISPNLIEQVFLTHLHSDHISGLDDLWVTGWVWQRDGPLHVSGPKGTNRLVENLREAYADDIAYRTANTALDNKNAQIESQEINAGVVYQQARVTIKAFLVDHNPVSPAFAYRIEFGDRVIVISGDTTYTDAMVEQARDADVLVHEIVAADENLLKKYNRLQSIVDYHTTPEQMAAILKQAKPRFTALTHVLLFGVEEQTVLDQIAKEYSGEVVVGYDLMKIGVGNKIKVEKFNPNLYE